MTELELAKAVDAAIDRTPAFKRAMRFNYLCRPLLDAVVQECAFDADGRIRPASKTQRALKNAAEGVGRGKWARLLGDSARLGGTHRLQLVRTRTPLALVLSAIKLPTGRSGAKTATDKREQLDEFLSNCRGDAYELYVASGQQGSSALRQNDQRHAALIEKLARKNGVSEAEMLSAVNGSRRWLVTTFGAKAVDNIRRNANRKRSY